MLSQLKNNIAGKNTDFFVWYQKQIQVFDSKEKSAQEAVTIHSEEESVGW